MPVIAEVVGFRENKLLLMPLGEMEGIEPGSEVVAVSYTHLDVYKRQVRSDDDGITWSEEINITPQIKDPRWRLMFQGPGNGITLTDGTMVFPAQFRDADGTPHSTIAVSYTHLDVYKRQEFWKITGTVTRLRS